MASLTKSQLINQLINHGVTPPSPGVKKEKLVEMYEKHVARHQEAAGEFSSDDEGPVKQQNGDEGSVSSLATDVSELNNEELAEHLRSYGVSVGPIVGTTRRLYERKLSKLLGAAGDAATTTTTTRTSTRTVTTVVNGGGGEDEYSDSEPEPEPEPKPEPELRQRRVAHDTAAAPPAAPAITTSTSTSSTSASVRSPAVRAVFLRDGADQPSPRRGVRDVRGSYPVEQYLPSKAAAAAESFISADVADSWSAPAPPPRRAARSGGRLRALVKLCVLLLLIAAAYYCYQHRDEAPSVDELQRAAREAVRRAAEKVDDLRHAASEKVQGLRQTAAAGGEEPAAKET